MAGTKEIKNRIESVQDTKKITNAMYLIASAKMRKAKADLDETRPYFDALQTEIKRIFRTSRNIENRYFYPPDGSHLEERTYALLVITADKGLAGAYNKNVIKEAEKMLKEHPDTKLFVVGEYGRRYFERRNIPVEQHFLAASQNPTVQHARDIAAVLKDGYVDDLFDKIFVIYTDLKKGMVEQVENVRLLPFHRAQFYAKENEFVSDTPFTFYPSMERVLDQIMYSYITGFIYSTLVDSFCCEQNARMKAMSAANDNADQILGELRIEYNRVRQAAITQEITEVSAGAKAQKRKREREAERHGNR